jgi:glycine betaine/proline transport system substrate-binding protein
MTILKWIMRISAVSFMFFHLLAVPAMAKDSVNFADLGWDSIQVHNRIVGFIFEHGYGKTVDYTFVELTPALLGLERGDIDINMELWPTYNIDWWDRAQKENIVKNFGINFEGASQGWYVPTYVIEGDDERGIEPSAPGLKSVFDLAEYWEVFRDPENPDYGRLYNGPSGWVAHDINIEKIKGYGLDEHYKPFSPGSGTALDSAIVSAYRQGRPVLFYYWEPTWLLGKFDMTRLKEPPYDEKLWNPENQFLCTWLTATTYVVGSRKFVEDYPELVPFLENYSTSLEQNQKVLAWLQENGTDLEGAATWFLEKYPGTWESWIQGKDREEVISRVERALAEKSK